MCTVSAVTDHYQRMWPTIQPRDWALPNGPYVPQPPMIAPGIHITTEQWQEYQRLKRMAEEIDEKTDQPDCIAPEKAQWEEIVTKILIERGVIK